MVSNVQNFLKKLLKEVKPKSKGIPTFKDISLNNIEVRGAKRAINVNGLENSYITNFHLKDVHIQAATAGQINYSKNWNLENVSLQTDDNSKVKIEHSPGVQLPDSLYIQ